MSVRVAPALVALLGLPALVALGCDNAPKRTAPNLTRAVMDAAAPALVVDEATLSLARAARDAAIAVVNACRLDDYGYWSEDTISYSDRCNWQHGEPRKMREAVDALRAGAPDAGDVTIFVAHAELFADWIDLTKETGTQGTLTHYQDFARAWNALRPSEPIDVDVWIPRPGEGPPVRPDAGGASTPLKWQRCSSSACIVFPRPKSNIAP
ncbi:MAG: hypothetical protein KIT84_31685 [Labilithrix sp.]|nr:hypothetical protein [Labilithrix sp.]MCW5815632.1 hypothetical protein [Labilithrix sp.]